MEIRVTDACPCVDDTVLLVALVRALVVTAVRSDAAPGDARRASALPESPHVLSRAATWRAARSGLDELLIDPWTVRPVPAVNLVHALLVHVRPVLEERG